MKLDNICKKSISNFHNMDSFIIYLQKYDIYDIFVNNKIILAGGAIVRILDSSQKGDFDFYFKDKIYIDKILIDINIYNESHHYKFDLIYKSNNAYTFQFEDNTFQFIILPHMINNNPKNIIDLFDFSICQVAYDFEFKDFIYGDTFLKDMDDRIIHYNLNSKCPISSLLRLNKYQNRLYTVENHEMLKIIFAIQNLKFETYSDVVFALTGISTVSYQKFIDFLNTDEIKNTKYDMMEFIILYEDFINAQKISEELIK